MSTSFGLMMILTGFAIMGFGLFIFYAWLPLLYALIGFDVGVLLGRALTGDVGPTAIVLGVAVAIMLGAMSYFLETYRRALLGVSGGMLLGLSVAAAFGLDRWFGGFFGGLLGIVCAVIGGLLVPRVFDLFVVGASSVSGAAIVMTGTSHILPSVSLFDRANGGLLPSLLTVILAIGGVIWQSSNLGKWVQKAPMDGSVSHASSGNHDDPSKR